MRPELKAQWIAALRSGKYSQGQHELRTPHDTFCCLGVLCDVINPSGWTRVPQNAAVGAIVAWRHEVGDGPDEAVGSHTAVRGNAVGLSESFIGGLIAMNDSGSTFEEIADVLQRSNERGTWGHEAGDAFEPPEQNDSMEDTLPL